MPFPRPPLSKLIRPKPEFTHFRCHPSDVYSQRVSCQLGAALNASCHSLLRCMFRSPPHQPVIRLGGRTPSGSILSMARLS